MIVISLLLLSLLVFQSCQAFPLGPNWEENSYIATNHTMFYEHKDLDGKFIAFKAPEEVNWVGGDWNDRISSIKIPNDTGVIAFKHWKFEGEFRKYTQSVGLVDMNDEFSSLIVAKRGCIVIFTGENFTGIRRQYCRRDRPERRRFRMFKSYISYDSRFRIYEDQSMLDALEAGLGYIDLPNDLVFERRGSYRWLERK